MTNKSLMTEERAKEIALEIVRCKVSRRSWEINPRNAEHPEWEIKAKKCGLDPESLKYFMLQIVMPVALSSHFGMEITFSKPEPRLSQNEILKMALVLVRNEGVDLTLNFRSQLERMCKQIKISPREVAEFYTTFIIPFVVNEIEKWNADEL